MTRSSNPREKKNCAGRCATNSTLHLHVFIELHQRSKVEDLSFKGKIDGYVSVI